MHINEVMSKLSISLQQAKYLDNLDNVDDNDVCNSVFEAAQAAKAALENPQMGCKRISEEAKPFYQQILDYFKQQFNKPANAEPTNELEDPPVSETYETTVSEVPTEETPSEGRPYAEAKTADEIEVLNTMVEFGKELAIAKLEDPNMNRKDFSFNGFPSGVKIINYGFKIDYSEPSNNRYQSKNYEEGNVTEIVEGADTIQTVVEYEYKGKKYLIVTDKIDATESKLPSKRTRIENKYDRRLENDNNNINIEDLEKYASNR